MMLFRLIGEQRMAAEIGLSKEQSEALRGDMRKLRERQIDLQAQLDKLTLRQADVVAGLLADRAKSTDEAKKLVDEIGAVRTDIAKLAIDRILIVRTHLTDAQIAKARELMKARMESMREGQKAGGPNLPKPPAPKPGDGPRPE